MKNQLLFTLLTTLSLHAGASTYTLSHPYGTPAEVQDNKNAAAQRAYEKIKSDERSIEFTDAATGAQVADGNRYVYEKSSRGLLCRKTAPTGWYQKIHYACYLNAATGRAASLAYKKLFKSRELNVVYHAVNDGSPYVGSEITEKSDSRAICQKIRPVVPHPVVSYACFQLQ